MNDHQMRQTDGTAEKLAGSAGAAASAASPGLADPAEQALAAEQAGLAGLAGLAGVAGLSGGAAGTRRDRLRTLGLWSALVLAAAALAGAGSMMWRSLQADKAIALVARSAMPTQADPALAPLPEVASAQDVAVAVSAPASLPGSQPASQPAPAVAPPAAAIAAAGNPDAAAPQAGAKLPAAQARVALARPGKQAQAPVKRAAVRTKAGLAGKSAALRRVKATAALRKPVTAGVQRRLAQCKERAGEAAAACFARACRSYARNAPICLNDEPVRRRR